jgi:dipeptidyl-peptidase 4
MKNILLILTILFITKTDAQKNITLEDIYKKNIFKSESVAGFASMQDGKYYSEINDKNQIQKVGFKDGKVKEIIVDLNELKTGTEKINFSEYKFDAKEEQLLLFANAENIYRRSFIYDVYLYNLKTKYFIKIGNKKLMHPSLNTTGNKLAYVSDNNLYVYDIATANVTSITTDGKWNNIINGNCDWVYEEEFGFSQAYSWSKTGNEIAYYKFDESQVKEFQFTMYDKLYPKQYSYKYPKAGEDNSKVNIYMYDVTTNKNNKVDIGSTDDIYIPRIYWGQYNNELFIYKLNRLQNHLVVFKAKPNEPESEVEYVEDNDKYLDITDNTTFLKSQNLFFYTSDKSGFNHIYVHDLNNHSDAEVTKGNYDDGAILSIDEKNKTIYYYSFADGATEKQIYATSYDGKKNVRITQNAGTHNITFSNGNTYYLDAYSIINTPTTYTIKDITGKFSRVLKDNVTLKNIMAQYNLQAQELIKVPNGIGDTLNAWILKPNNYNDGKSHPLLMFQYSGPGSQQITNSFMGRDYFWYQMLAQQGYVIACVDGRGTGARGAAFKKCTYKQLGNLESDDQIAAAKYFGTFPFIDKNRIGIWGWSYGGFMSSICISKGADVFKSAIAVAPVTNWRFYDNIYTERYMQKPQDNAKGYDDNSPINMVSKMKGNFLLIHGSGDDNVHYQNTMEMINAMIAADKEFDSEAYPNRAHGISGGNTRYHLYKRLTKFVLEKL